jgi:hypothetical protein
MSNETKHESTPGHGSFERQDLQVSGILYFLLGLAVATLLCALGIRGLFAFLEHREKALQPPVNPLVTNVPADTRRIPGDSDDYLKKAFPDPRLENDESRNFSKARLTEDQTLESYGWVDEKAGTVRIPIERAMDLLVQRGLPVRSHGATSEIAAVPETKTGSKNRKSVTTGANKKGVKK